MANFNTNQLQNILPDPNNRISHAGDILSSNAGTGFGPGFASFQLTSEQPTLRNFTNSGRLLARSIVAHKWKVAIKYNKLTQVDFDRIYSFIINRRGALNPFFVSLPNYRVPRDSSFATYAASANLQIGSGLAAGSTQALISKSGFTVSGDGKPSPGDLFTISGTNSNHKKAYMVTRVETQADYTGTQPSASQVRIHFTPGLAKTIATNDDFIFHNPLIQVITSGDIQQYTLDSNNLYSFSLNLEEIQ